MKIYADYTDNCYKEAEKYNLKQQLDNLINKIESQQTTRFLEKYQSPAIVKRVGRYRIIGYEKQLDNDIFVVFLRVMLRGDREYNDFYNNSDNYCKNILPDNEWFEQKIRSKQNEKIVSKPSLSEIEKKYLFYPLEQGDDFDWMVYESKEFKEIDKSSHLQSIHRLLLRIVENDYSDQVEIKDDNYGITLIFRKIDQNRIIYLRHVKLNSNLNEGNLEKIKNEINNLDDFNLVIKNSYRAYPDYIIYDYDLWVSIQKDEEANIALSTEETEILNSIFHNIDNRPLFPLFINGRAGSGKSTILYYLFSHILLNHILQKNRLGNPPIFLTYSQKLLQTAKTTIRKILETNFKIQARLNETSNRLVREYLNSEEYNRSFFTFRQFQKQLLPQELQVRFHDSNYFSFSNFKKDWDTYKRTNPSASIRKLSAEMAWYVIRTFIKGMYEVGEGYLQPEDYEFIARDLKTIDKNLYENIYNNVFVKWYKEHLEKNDLWDDQDLTRCVLENVDSKNLEYPAIFCDEAQDFSGIELELISELSLFTKRNLRFDEVKRVPIAFAGDPLQTINPTGFNWERIKAIFYEKLKRDFISPYNRIELNYKELKNNYRSTQQIVVFNNIIQLIRSILFNLKNLYPQKSWFVDSGLSPVLTLDLTAVRNALSDPRKSIIIIPSEEDDEKNYIQNKDSFLNQYATREDNLLLNIWSPMNVKGLEFNTVIVYKFGDHLFRELNINLKDIINDLLIEDEISNNLNYDKRIELEFFLNKLYVATTRAKKHLIIIDTQEGYDALWSIIDDKNIADYLPLKYSETIDSSINWDEEYQISNFRFLKEIDINNLETENPEDLAKQYEQDGESSFNPRKMRTAAEYYRISGSREKADKCLAYAFELEKDFSNAAKYYKRANELDKASKCYWINGVLNNNDINKYIDIVNLYENEQNVNDLFYLASKYMLNENRLSDTIRFVTRDLMYSVINERNIERYLLNRYEFWQIEFDEIMKNLYKISKDNPGLSEWDSIIDGINVLSNKGIKIKNNQIYINILYNLGNYNEIVTEIETNTRDFNNILYLEAKAETTNYPEKLEYYYRANKYSKIVEQYKTHELSYKNYDIGHLSIILNSILETSSQNILLKFLISHSETLRELFEREENLLSRLLFYLYDHSLYQLSFKLLDNIQLNKPDDFYINLINDNLYRNDGKLINYLVSLYFYQELISSNYVVILDILKERRASFRFVNEKINKATLEKILIHTIALSKSPISRRNWDLQNYLHNLLVESDKWKSICNVRVAGTALEKLDYHIYARDFYEKIISGNYDNEDKEFAKRRWLKVKLKQADSLNDDKIKSDIKRDVEIHYKRWGYEYDFDLTELENYPTIEEELNVTFEESYSRIDMPKEKIMDYQLNIIIGDKDAYTIKYLIDKNIIKIDNEKKNETVYYDINRNEFESREVDITVLDMNDNKTYHIPDWSLYLQIISINNSKHNYLRISYNSIDDEILIIPIRV